MQNVGLPKLLLLNLHVQCVMKVPWQKQQQRKYFLFLANSLSVLVKRFLFISPDKGKSFSEILAVLA